MKRTISAEVGKGSVNHNSRKFRAENVDGSRTHLNIDYCNERIQTVYHQLFDEALKRYRHMRRQDLYAKKSRPRLAEASARLFYFFHGILRLSIAAAPDEHISAGSAPYPLPESP